MILDLLAGCPRRAPLALRGTRCRPGKPKRGKRKEANDAGGDHAKLLQL